MPQPPVVAVKKLQIEQLLSGLGDMAVQCNEFLEVISSALIFFESTQTFSAAPAAEASAPPIEI